MADYEFGNKLAAMRIACGYSQFQVGRLVGVTDKAVSKWENGQTKPRMSVCKRLASLYGVTIDLLLNGDTEKNPSVAEQKKEQLWKQVKEKLYDKFGPHPNTAFLSRFESEKIALENSDIILHMNAICSLIRAATNKYNQLFAAAESNGSFIAWLMGVSNVNPLPPYTYCPHCHRTELHKEVQDGWDLPEQYCPDCGTKLERDGHAIPFAEYAYRVNRQQEKHFQLSVSETCMPKCKKILDEAYAGIYQVQPYDRVISGRRVKPNPLDFQQYILMPLGEKASPLDTDGYMLIESDDTDPLHGLYPTIGVISSPLNWNIKHVIEACKENRFSLTKSIIQDQKLYEAYWEKRCKANPANKIIMTHEILEEMKHFGIFFPDVADPRAHHVEWSSVAKLKKDTPIGFSMLLKAEMIFAKGDWENRYGSELQKDHFTLADIPVEPQDIYKKILTKLTPDACVGTDFILKIIADMREGKYYENGVPKETRELLQSIGLEDWYIDFIDEIDPFKRFVDGIDDLIAKLAICRLEQDGIEVNANGEGFDTISGTGSRITISEKNVLPDEVKSLRDALEERKKTQTAQEIMSDFMEYLLSDSDEPFK